VIYLYAIIERLARAPACVGLNNGEVLAARASEVAGIYSRHEQIEARPEPAVLWRHEQVVEAAMGTGPALPVRFGTTFADENALLSSLEREGQRLSQRLDRVRGCVELAIRVGQAEARPREQPPRDGRAYVESKLDRLRRRQAIVRDTLRPLGDLAVETSHADGGSESEVVCASYLVESDQVDRFSESVTHLAERNPRLWLSCTGPWPPYSFSGLEEAA